jgi:hypothetical protein
MTWATLYTAATRDSHTLQSRSKQVSHLPFDSFKPLGLINYSILSVDAHFWPLLITYIDDNNRYCKLVCANYVNGKPVRSVPCEASRVMVRIGLIALFSLTYTSTRHT